MVTKEELKYPIGSCSCLTKSPDAQYHDKKCPVWLYHQLYAVLEEKEKENNFVIRPQTSEKEMELLILNYVIPKMERRLERHGYGLAAGPHEILGILVEEMNEFEDEVRANDHVKCFDELLDIAIGAIFGMQSMSKRIQFERRKNRNA